MCSLVTLSVSECKICVVMCSLVTLFVNEWKVYLKVLINIIMEGLHQCMTTSLGDSQYILGLLALFVFCFLFFYRVHVSVVLTNSYCLKFAFKILTENLTE